MDKHLLLMYDRPGEPIFIPKGENNTIFDIPPEYMTERYQSMALSIFNRFGQNAEENVAVKKIALPDLSLPMTLSRYEMFSIYSPSHRKMADYLIELFIGEFVSLSISSNFDPLPMEMTMVSQMR
ncbi:hypothetical protein QAD02_014944 [Eretmocerus hayati]|uniref:Uncharacterized protein n=1 Tax=Eretmocerus hayati TaxID=131215 RepID=A0ACC2P6V7_9HYME|nr:hypothetical protein QAD02_014944 [Eretmocerus hayati]